MENSQHIRQFKVISPLYLFHIYGVEWMNDGWIGKDLVGSDRCIIPKLTEGTEQNSIWFPRQLSQSKSYERKFMLSKWDYCDELITRPRSPTDCPSSRNWGNSALWSKSGSNEEEKKWDYEDGKLLDCFQWWDLLLVMLNLPFCLHLSMSRSHAPIS
jgi:hypothetical protein